MAIGVILMAVISSFISLLPGLSIWQDAIKGAIIIAAVLLNIATSRFSEKRALRERRCV